MKAKNQTKLVAEIYSKPINIPLIKTTSDTGETYLLTWKKLLKATKVGD